MAFGMPPITDFCFLVEDVERSVAFYRDKLGFELRTRAEGFADFKTEHVAFALWEIDHIAATVGISNKRSGPGVHRSIGAIELKKPEEVDVLYAQLSSGASSSSRRRRITPGRRAASISPIRTNISGRCTRGSKNWVASGLGR